MFFSIILVAGLSSCNKDDVIIADEPELPSQVGDFDPVFAGASYFQRATERYTFVGRPVFITPVVEGDSYEWCIDGRLSDCTTATLKFTPEAPGDYVVDVTIDGTVNGRLTVVCVPETERQMYRPGESKELIVYEYVPAPGQFINESVGDMTRVEAAGWAAGRIKDRDFVSLGGFGGYIVVGFGHSIRDFIVKGNAFTNKSGASNEPGIVYVMQDVNGNGRPDEEWYELRGSETGSDATVQNYAVTYRRPAALGQPVDWLDCFGEVGQIDYMAPIHKQDYYYPSWIEEDEYTLRGTLVAARSERDQAGQWVNYPLESGYADNTGSNNDVFYIADAMFDDLSPVRLEYIDFIKIQTGVNGKCGPLGELSTEISEVSER